MKTFSSKIFLSLLAIFLLGMIFFNFEKNISFPDQNWSIEKENKIAIDSQNQTFQKFTASENNLSGIEILFSQSDKKKIGGKIKLQLAEENCRDVLAEDFLPVDSLNSEFTHNFSFPKITDSQNRHYCLSLVFVPDKESKKTPQVFITNAPAEKQTALITATGEELKNQSLSMRPAYRNDNIWQDMTELNKRISQYKPWFLKHYFLSFIVISFILFSILLVAILLII